MNINEIKTLIYPVKDIAQARALYVQFLETGPYMDETVYLGFRIGDLEMGEVQVNHDIQEPGGESELPL